MPALPPPVVVATTEAVASIGPDGELPAAALGRVHALVDDAARELHPEAGRYVRAKLALACAYATLGHARSEPDLFADAESVASLATAALHGDGDADELEARMEALAAVATDRIGATGVEPRALYAVLACVAAVGTLLYDTAPEELAVDPSVSDPTDWDASFLSSLAHAGGAVWDGTGDPVHRARFWRWYLDEALPYAWDTDRPAVPYPPVMP